MAINFDSALGIHQHALMVRARRSELLSANLANADTPNYKARDIDFRQVLNRISTEQSQNGGADTRVSMTRTGHQMANADRSALIRTEDVQFRQALQPSEDGNTVESHIENAAFAENAVRYQASLHFLGGKFSSLKMAITGGR